MFDFTLIRIGCVLFLYCVTVICVVPLLTCFMILMASCACCTSAGVFAKVRALNGSSARAIMNPRSVEVDCWGGACMGIGWPGYVVK